MCYKKLRYLLKIAFKEHDYFEKSFEHSPIISVFVCIVTLFSPTYIVSLIYPNDINTTFQGCVAIFAYVFSFWLCAKSIYLLEFVLSGKYKIESEKYDNQLILSKEKNYKDEYEQLRVDKYISL